MPNPPMSTTEFKSNCPVALPRTLIPANMRSASGNELTPELAETFGLKDVEGVIITGVLQNAPAAKAGLRPGDVLVRVAGEPVRHVGELLTRIAALTPGVSAKIEVMRRNQALTLEVTPTQRPKTKAVQR